MKKYILYARVASEQQKDKGQSLNSQIERMLEYAKHNNLTVGKVISEAASGISKDRKGFKKMVSILSKGQYQGILCSGIDRLSRDFVTTARMINFVKQNNLEVVTPSETFKGSFIDSFKLSILTGISNYLEDQRGNKKQS